MACVERQTVGKHMCNPVTKHRVDKVPKHHSAFSVIDRNRKTCARVAPRRAILPVQNSKPPAPATNLRTGGLLPSQRWPVRAGAGCILSEGGRRSLPFPNGNKIAHCNAIRARSARRARHARLAQARPPLKDRAPLRSAGWHKPAAFRCPSLPPLSAPLCGAPPPPMPMRPRCPNVRLRGVRCCFACQPISTTSFAPSPRQATNPCLW